MQVLLTQQKKFNIHNIGDLNKMVNLAASYAMKHGDIDVPILNQEDDDSYFRLVYDKDDSLFYSYVSIDNGVWLLKNRSLGELASILQDNILKNDN